MCALARCTGEAHTKRDPAQLLKQIGACLPQALDCAVLRRQIGSVRWRGIICRTAYRNVASKAGSACEPHCTRSD